MSRATVSPRRWFRQPALRRRRPAAAAGTGAGVGVPDITTYSARWNTHISYTRQPPASSRRAQLAPGPGARGSGVNGCSCCSMVFYFAFLVGFAVVFLIVLPEMDDMSHSQTDIIAHHRSSTSQNQAWKAIRAKVAAEFSTSLSNHQGKGKCLEAGSTPEPLEVTDHLRNDSKLLHIHHTGTSQDYQRHWQPSIREFVQNAVDALHLREPRTPNTTVHLSDDARLLEVHQGERLLFRVHSGMDRLVMSQWMPPGRRLQQSALLRHSRKSLEKGHVGGFGEGLNVAALQLLRAGYSLVYIMHQRSWTFAFEPHTGYGEGIRELRVRVHELPQRNDSTLVIQITRESDAALPCSCLFSPENYLVFAPRPVLLDMHALKYRVQVLAPVNMSVASLANASLHNNNNPAFADDRPRSVFVNGLFFKRTKLLSFDVNLFLSVREISPDRDALRGVLAHEILRNELEHVLTGSTTLPAHAIARRLCYEVIMSTDGEPPEDLRRLNDKSRRALLPEFQREHGKDAMPLEPHAPSRRKHSYRILGWTPVVSKCSRYLMRNWDLDKSLAEKFRSLRDADVPAVAAAQADYDVLQSIINRLDEVLGFELVSVRFVHLPAGAQSVEYHDWTIYVSAAYLDAGVCRRIFRGMPQLQAWVNLVVPDIFQCIAYINDPQLRGHAKKEMALVFHNPRYRMRSRDEVSSITSTTAQSNVPGAATPQHTPEPVSSNSAIPSDSQPTQRHVERTGDSTSTSSTQHTANSDEPWSASPPAASVDVSRVVSNMQRTPPSAVPGGAVGGDAERTESSVIPTLHALAFDDRGQNVTLFAAKRAAVPQDVLQRTFSARRNLRHLLRDVFTDIPDEFVHFAYLPSSLMGFYSPDAHDHVFVNLYYAKALSDLREGFRLLCHEFTHMAGYGPHDELFAETMADLTFKYSGRFHALARGLANSTGTALTSMSFADNVTEGEHCTSACS